MSFCKAIGTYIQLQRTSVSWFNGKWNQRQPASFLDAFHFVSSLFHLISKWVIAAAAAAIIKSRFGRSKRAKSRIVLGRIRFPPTDSTEYFAVIDSALTESRKNQQQFILACCMILSHFYRLFRIGRVPQCRNSEKTCSGGTPAKRMRRHFMGTLKLLIPPPISDSDALHLEGGEWGSKKPKVVRVRQAYP